jgi:cyclopropane fatty-acyl-phospholipid synthase-like methyltransferase
VADERQPCAAYGWAFTHLEIPEGATAMDVGCGGGRTINKLAAKAAQVYGIDYAAGSVAASRAHNKRLIAEGQCMWSRLRCRGCRLRMISSIW